MAERQILFSGPMVRAILNGRKTQTRRVINPQPDTLPQSDYVDGHWWYEDRYGQTRRLTDRCPYGRPGDLLYVRETWRPFAWHEGEPIVVEFAAGGPHQECDTTLDGRSSEWEMRLWEQISDELRAKGIPYDENGVYPPGSQQHLRWRPSIHLPKWAARLWLRVTDIRVERLQDITEADALAEGCTGGVCNHEGRGYHGCTDCYNTGWLEPPEVEFIDLWDGLNAKRGYGWDTNPWVWVVEFEREDV